MSKRMIAVCVLIVGTAASCLANEVYEVFNYGSGAMNGIAPAGMRFGDIGHVSGMSDGTGLCQSCYGVQAPVCDPCWGGPCMDWKLNGWYSYFPCQPSSKGRRCCAQTGSQGNQCCASTAGGEGAACETCK